jgi:hypothetical protein
MRATIFTAVGFCLTAASAFGQQRRESDSTFIARERAAWNALKDADSAAFVRAVGASPSLYFVWERGVDRTSAARFAGLVTKCDTRSHKLDLFNVVRPNDDTAILIYRVTMDRSCGATVDRGLREMVMTVWARRDGRWQAIVQSLVRLLPNNDSK